MLQYRVRALQSKQEVVTVAESSAVFSNFAATTGQVTVSALFQDYSCLSMTELPRTSGANS